MAGRPNEAGDEVMNGKVRADIRIGSEVAIVLKEDQRTGALTRGRGCRPYSLNRRPIRTASRFGWKAALSAGLEISLLINFTSQSIQRSNANK